MEEREKQPQKPKKSELKPAPPPTKPAPSAAKAPPGATPCDRCGAPMIEWHCELICTKCGYKRDCGDP
ncbi:MAG: hypothetical protein ACREJQ_04390 [bacterium]